METIEKKPLVKSFVKETEFSEEKKIPKKTILIILAFILVLAGIGTGYLLSGRSVGQSQVLRSVNQEEVKPGVIVGVVDEQSFKDSAEGKLEKGGVDGEGSHHLVRPGGDSQNVYLTSSIVELDKFVGRKVKVWGQTFSAQKAGWLMDVGKLKVLE